MPHLPDELWLLILSYLPPQDIWTTTKPLTHQLTRLSEDYLTSPLFMAKLTVGISLSLGAGSRHRWYDIRGTITFSFQHFSAANPQYALFGACLVHPQSCHVKAMEKWKQVSANGVGGREEWRVQHGYDGEVRQVKLPNLVVADGGNGVWCDWRELLDACFGPAMAENIVTPENHIATRTPSQTTAALPSSMTPEALNELVVTAAALYPCATGSGS